MITEEIYHTDTSHISKSGLDQINKSPAHYYHSYLDKVSMALVDKKQTRDMLIGEVFHCVLMEPHLISSRYHVTPVKIDRRTRQGRSDWEKHQHAAKGRRVINRDIWNMAIGMADAVNRHPIAKELFKSGIAEKIFTFIDPETGVKCKIKPDWIHKQNIIVDLKSTVDSWCDFSREDGTQYDAHGQPIPEFQNGMPITSNRYKGFPKSLYNYRYDVQNAFYADGYQLITGIKPEFIFVAVEKEFPFQVALYTLSEERIEDGREAYRRNLRTYKSCMEQNVWPGYPKQIIKIV